MSTKTIAIIGGIGAQASALATKLADTGNHLLLFSDEATRVRSLIRSIKTKTPGAKITSAHCPADASWEADIIVCAVALDENESIRNKIESFSNRKILIDISSEDNRVNVVDAVKKTKELQRQLHGVRLVKIFNISFAGELATDGMVVGNDDDSLYTVYTMLSEINHRNIRLVNVHALEKIR